MKKSTANTTNILLSSISNIAPYIEYCDKRSLDWRTIALECGLPIELTQSSLWLPTQDLVRFIDLLERKFGYTIGIEVGIKATLKQLSPDLHEKIQQCDSLEQAIRCLIAEIQNLSNHITIWTEYKNGFWWLCHRSCYRPSIAGFEQAEWFRTLTMISLCRPFIDPRWQPSHAKLVSSSQNANKLPHHFHHSHIEFQQPYGAVVIPLAENYRAVAEKTASLNWHHSVITLINTYATLPWFNIDWFAEILGMTKRTLQRNLKSRDILFKDEKEKVRHKKAKQLLEQTDLSVQEISWQVGYSDLSNFNRAFKKWANISAPQYRRNYRHTE